MMATQAVQKTAFVDGTEPAVEDLIRTLVSHAEVSHAEVSRAEVNHAEVNHAATAKNAGAASPAVAEGEEILLDADVDGARYLLIRLPSTTDRPQVQLSPREQEIVRMVAQGHPNKIIAEVLNISAWTVCTHLRRIFAKAGVGSRAAMVARLFEGRAGRSDNAQHPLWSARQSHGARQS